jgi:hypothetical protein
MTIEQFHPAGEKGAIPGKSCAPPLHIHELQRECFEAVRGTIGILREDEDIAATPEETAIEPICIEPYVKHTYYIAANETDLVVKITLTPALHMEAFYRTLLGLRGFRRYT